MSGGARRWAAVVIVLLHAACALGALSVEVAPDGDAAVRVTVVNDGGEAAQGVRPELLYRHRSEQQPAVDLAPGERREWRFPLDAPPSGSRLPAVVRVRYDAGGRVAVLPAVTTVAGAVAGSEVVRARLDAPAIAGVAHGVLVAENPGPRPVAARAAFVLPSGLTADPESMPAEIPAGGRVSLPVVLQNDGALTPGHYPAFAILEYGASGVEHTAVTRAVLRVVGDDARRRRRPLVIGTAATIVALVLLTLALRRGRAPSERSG